MAERVKEIDRLFRPRWTVATVGREHRLNVVFASVPHWLQPMMIGNGRARLDTDRESKPTRHWLNQTSGAI